MTSVRILHIDGGYSDSGRSQFLSTHSPLKVKDFEGKTKKLAWDSLIDAEILDQGQEPDTLKSAAAGAAVGFLLAGPLGTAIGGLAGRGKAISDSTQAIVAFSFKGPVSVVAQFSRSQVNEIRALLMSIKNLEAGTDEEDDAPTLSLSDIEKTCPGCVGKIHLKSSRCKHCGYEFSADHVSKSVDEELKKALKAEAESKGIFQKGLDYPLNHKGLLQALESHCSYGEIAGFNQEVLLPEIIRMSDQFFERVKELAAEKGGGSSDSFYSLESNGPDIEGFLEAWTELHGRLPWDEACWEPESYLECTADNSGLIISSVPDNPDLVAIFLSRLLIEYGFSARKQMNMDEGFFPLFKELPSRLYIGDLSEAKRLCEELSSLGFEVIVDEHCLPIYDSKLELEPASEMKRREFVESLQLGQIGESLVQRAHLEASDFYYGDEESRLDETDGIASGGEASKGLVPEGSKEIEKAKSAAKEEKKVGFFGRLLRALFFGAVNLVLMVVLFYLTPETYQGATALALLVALSGAILLRLFKNNRADLVLMVLQIVALIALGPLGAQAG